MSNKNPTSDEYGTPIALVKRAAALLGRTDFDLDVCATTANTRAGFFFTKQVNGLQQNWCSLWTARRSSSVVSSRGKCTQPLCWMNPPYSNSAAWCKKAVETACAAGRVLGLLKVDPGLSWWGDYVHNVARKVWWLPRIWFVGATCTANFSSCLVYWENANVIAATQYWGLYNLTPEERGFPERKRKQHNRLLTNFDWV